MATTCGFVNALEIESWAVLVRLSRDLIHDNAMCDWSLIGLLVLAHHLCCFGIAAPQVSNFIVLVVCVNDHCKGVGFLIFDPIRIIVIIRLLCCSSIASIIRCLILILLVIAEHLAGLAGLR